MTNTRIRPKERDSIIQSLRSGVTPKIGIQHIQVGRAAEITALNRDVDRIADGGAAFRLVIGEYGSGKTFFLSVVKSIALEKKLVVVTADLSPSRRIHASAGQSRNLYSQLMSSMATRNKPDGNAIKSVVERFITQVRKDAEASSQDVSSVIHSRLDSLSDMVGGYDFAKVIEQYWLGHEQGSDQLQSNAIRWLRAEYTTKTEARQDLGVRTIIDDASFYDSLKLMALFIRQAGYSGLLVNLDEMVNLYKLNSSQARASNYEQLLRMLNDCLQGSSEGIGFILSGTPEFLLDTRKGLYSYDALQSRLAENSFAKQQNLTDYSATVLHLSNLAAEELYILLKNLRHVFAAGDSEAHLVPDEALTAFLEHCHATIGQAYFQTPRNTVKAFLDFLAVLEQDPERSWSDLIPAVEVEPDRPSTMADFGDDTEERSDTEELADFRI